MFVPTENGAKDLIELEEVERVRHGEDADDHGTNAAENCSKNQSLERGLYAHSFRLPAAMPPRPPDLLLLSMKSRNAVSLA